jgi:hypothetical protein
MGLRRRWARQDAANVGIGPSASPSAEGAFKQYEQTAREASVGGDKVVDQVRRYLEESDDSNGPLKNVELAQVGAHVASVLAAAESAAERLRSEAGQAAERTRREAVEAADDLRALAASEVEAQRTEVRRQTSLAEEEAGRARADADGYTQTRRHEADEEATRIVQEAQDRAEELAATAAYRHHELLTDISASETRMRRLATSLREVADRLDDVAGTADQNADAGADDASHDSKANSFNEGDEQVLDETLVARIGEEAR